MHTTDSERAKYSRAWALDDYRKSSPGLDVAPRVFDLLGMRFGQSVTDYGCGEGHAVRWFAAKGLGASGVDIVPLLSEYDGGIECCLWEMDDRVPEADYATCFDVMEHLPPERADEVLAEIRERTRIGAAFTISTVPDAHGRKIGEKLHLTVKRAAWWRAKLRGHWGSVDVLKTEKRWRVLFVCTDG